MVKHSMSRSKCPLALVPFLLLLVTTTKPQACDRNHLRLILEQDVVQYIYPAFQASPCSIYDLLSTRSCTFWCAPASLALPRGIDITFAQPFVLEGIFTQGKDNGFVSKFTVLYSESSDGPLQSFVDVTLPSDNGHSFILPPVSIVMQRLRLLMTDTSASPTSGYFYWHLDFLGCTLASTNKTAGGPPDTDTDITLVSSPVMAIPSANEGSIVVVSPTISTPTIDPTIVQSSTISIQMDTNMPSSSSRRKHKTVTVTETVSSCSVSADVPMEKVVSGNTTAGLAGAVVPLLIIIMILVTVLIVLLVLIYRKRRNHSENTRERCESLKVSSNILHEDFRINKPTDDVPMISMNLNGDGMRNNLECSAVPGEDSLPPSNAGATKLAEIQEGNKIFVDPVYSKIESNDCTSKYEYEYMSPGREEGGDGSTVAHDIDTKLNPAYSYILRTAQDYESFVPLHDTQ